MRLSSDSKSMEAGGLVPLGAESTGLDALFSEGVVGGFWEHPSDSGKQERVAIASRWLKSKLWRNAGGG